MKSSPWTFLCLAALALSSPREAAAHRWTHVVPVPGPGTERVMVFDASRGRLVLVRGAYTDGGLWESDGASAWAWRAYLRWSTPGAGAYDGARAVTVIFPGEGQDATYEWDGQRLADGVPVPPALTNRREHRMAYDAARARVVLYGGFDSGSHKDTWEYDGTAWTQGPDAPAVRTYPAMAYDAGRARMVLFGGRDQTGKATRDAFEYDGVSWAPAAVAPPPALAPRYAAAMAYDGARGRMVIFGGDDGLGTLGDTWEYDGVAWSAGAAAPAAMRGREGAAMAYDDARAVVVLFGGNGGTTAREDLWQYDGTAWQPSPLMRPRYDQAAAYDGGRRRVVLFGGTADPSGALLADTWELDGAAWTKGPAAPASLTPREGHAMAYDAARGRIVLVGGYDGALRADAWEYDGAAWSALPAPGGPSPRWQHAMAYDAARGRIVLFGGWDGTYRGDTWLLDASAWTAASTGPSARAQHAMAYDAARGRTVLYGGTDGAALKDTWEWDGSSWTRGPDGPRTPYPALGYAPRTGRVVLFAGTNGTSSSVTFTYDGSAWNPAFPMYSGGYDLPGRLHGAMATDPTGQGVVLVGGFASGPLADTWLLDAVDGSICGAGYGYDNGNRVVVLDVAGTATGIDFVAYGAGHWGVGAAGAELDGTGASEIVTGPGPGPIFGPQVRGFSGTGGGTPVAKVDYFAYGTLRYGVNVERGDVDGDGVAEILSAPGPGPVFAPLVRGWDYTGGVVRPIGAIAFVPFSAAQYGGRAAGGDVDADGFDEIAATPGPGGGPAFPARVLGFDYDGAAVAPIDGYAGTFFTSQYGGRIAFGHGNGPEETLVVGPGPDPSSRSEASVVAYEGYLHEIDRFYVFVARFGTNVGCGPFGR